MARMNENTIVAMLATLGVEEFLQNALRGIEAAGIDPRIVHVARPDNASDVIDPILGSVGAQAISFTRFCDPSPDLAPHAYVEYGTEPFISINWAKVRYLRWLLDRYRHVVYADVDVAWLSDPLWYLQSVALHYPLAFQTEAVPRFPPVCCWGFVSMKATDASRRLLDELLLEHETRQTGSLPLDEQIVCDALVTKDPSWVSQIFPLPETLFLNGLSYKALLADPPSAAPMHGALTPFTFHANWTTGLRNKRALMVQTGTWLLN
jgi:Nucleotide-diphospho-sugar transferase